MLIIFTVNSVSANNYLMATASTGGTFYPVGVAIATLIKVKLQPTNNIGMSAISSAGSGENIKLMRDNEVQFSILQGLFGLYAAEGSGPITNDGPQKNLRSITMLWPNVEHFVIQSKYVKTGTIMDLADMKGEHMSMGKQNSGTIGSNSHLLNNLGINIENDFNLIYAGYNPTADAMQNRQIAGFGAASGVPGSMVTKVAATLNGKIKVLDFTDEQLAKADGGAKLWTRYVIPAGTYVGQSKDIQTIAQPNFLCVRDDVSIDDVYLITKTIYENLPFLNAIHPATKAMAIDRAIIGLPMPLHPGAAKYYKEMGIDIPVRLISE